MIKERFDAIVIGSGQAGTPLAMRLGKKRKKVALIERHLLGGTCVNNGCTPTKYYVASARRAWDARHGQELGVYIPQGSSADMAQIHRRMDEARQEAQKKLLDAIAEIESLELFRETAYFSGHKQITVGDRVLEADKIFINVGGEPIIPKEYEAIPVLTNKSILNLTSLPEHLVIVGGSYISLEFAQIFRRFGSQVTVIERSERILKREDPHISESIHASLEKEGVTFLLNASCINSHISKGGNPVVVLKNNVTAEEFSVEGSHVLLAVGRTPQNSTLSLDSTGVKLDDKGFIDVNDHCETNVEGIYALGDCNGRGAFTHTAFNDYQIVYENLYKGRNRKISDRITCYRLFVDPPLGRVGMTTTEALEKGYKVKVSSYKVADIARAKEKGETEGIMEITIDAKSDLILGASIHGVGGDEIIASILNTMYAGKPYTTIRDAVHIHPTISELIPTMLEKTTLLN